MPGQGLKVLRRQRQTMPRSPSVGQSKELGIQKQRGLASALRRMERQLRRAAAASRRQGSGRYKSAPAGSVDFRCEPRALPEVAYVVWKG